MTCFRLFCMKKRRNTDADLSKKVETGNRIIRADYKEGTDGTIVLYRGIQILKIIKSTLEKIMLKNLLFLPKIL